MCRWIATEPRNAIATNKTGWYYNTIFILGMFSVINQHAPTNNDMPPIKNDRPINTRSQSSSAV